MPASLTIIARILADPRLIGRGQPSPTGATFFFVAYYPALAIFAVVFTSFRINLVWTTVAAAALIVVSIFAGSGLDLDAGDEQRLFAQVIAMYLITVGISLVIRFERARRQAAMERERQAQQERIDLSQAIHDTTAQTAYMIGLGIDRARELAGEANVELIAALDATMSLARSAMWEVRGPVGSGQILEGRTLGRVLWSHCATFERITGIPTELFQSGSEPPLSAETRTRLFSIAHNALTNAFLHARAGRIDVGLNFDAERIELSVADDGVGLPEDFAERGRGFNGMRADADALGGTLTVVSSREGSGTTVTCVIPRETR